MMADETKHTPGPWRFKPRHHADILADGSVKADFEGAPEAWTVWRTWHDEQGRRCHRPIGETYLVGQEWPEGEANARLITAAPELLAALTPIVPLMRAHHDRGGGLFSTAEVEACEAAIAKATA